MPPRSGATLAVFGFLIELGTAPETRSRHETEAQPPPQPQPTQKASHDNPRKTRRQGRPRRSRSKGEINSSVELTRRRRGVQRILHLGRKRIGHVRRIRAVRRRIVPPKPRSAGKKTPIDERLLLYRPPSRQPRHTELRQKVRQRTRPRQPRRNDVKNEHMGATTIVVHIQRVRTQDRRRRKRTLTVDRQRVQIERTPKRNIVHIQRRQPTTVDGVHQQPINRRRQRDVVPIRHTPHHKSKRSPSQNLPHPHSSSKCQN